MGNRIQNAYGVGGPIIPVFPIPIRDAGRAPNSNDTNYPQGQQWFVGIGAGAIEYVYQGAGVWATGTPGSISSVLGTANQITATTVGSVVTLSIPSAFIAPGSIASTTTVTAGTGLTVTTGNATVSAGNITATLGNISATAGSVSAGTTLSAGTTVTAGTGITATTGNIVATTGNITTTAGSITSATTLTATLGNITATNGNFVSSTAGKGLVFPVATASGAASGPVVCNGRQGSVSFTSPSIAAGATSTLTVTNSAVTGSGTLVIYSLRGSTTGAALNLQSVTNSAGSSAVVVENGTGATTQTDTITLDFIVIN